MADSRLDPVRWRRPGRSTLLRLGVVATLLVVAALVAWAGPSDGIAPQACAPPTARARAGAHAAASPSASNPGARSSDAETGARPANPETGGRPPIPDGSVGVPIRLAEPTALSLVRPGDRVDLLRVEAAGGTTAVAEAALVLGITGVDDPITGGLLIALSPTQAKRAVAGPGRAFAVLLRPG